MGKLKLTAHGNCWQVAGGYNEDQCEGTVTWIVPVPCFSLCVCVLGIYVSCTRVKSWLKEEVLLALAGGPMGGWGGVCTGRGFCTGRELPRSGGWESCVSVSAVKEVPSSQDTYIPCKVWKEDLA